MGRSVRIGIDVGGTFTDAIALDNNTYDVIGIKKQPTTHDAAEGVILGVINVLNSLLEEIKISPDDVVFIAHGTTQATNALLEGDVAGIGIIGMAKGGIGMAKAKADTQTGDIPLADGKSIKTQHIFINTANGIDRGKVEEAVKAFMDLNLSVAVCSESFSVDDPSNENEAVAIMTEKGMIATAGHEISKLYGLRARTRTAVINGSILPKMMQTAYMTNKAVNDAKIKAPMMIMRSDGGVMQMDEVKRRPLLTVLSGPAAGVAGALMYEKISDGIFLEVGGTSTDISAIQNGKVMTKYAKIGGHSTYVPSLDISTVGIAGGSMVLMKAGKISAVGPRSAHIAGLDYAVYADKEDLRASAAENYNPAKLDKHEYLCVRAGGRRFAVTSTCAANYLKYVKEGDYAYAPEENGRILFEDVLSRDMGKPAVEIARQIMDLAAAKVIPAVEDFIKEYNLNRSYLVLTGGGGGAGTIVPAVAEKLGLKCRIANNAPVISTIGAALAMVRDSVERTIVNPSKDDILKIRAEAVEAAMKAGAARETIQVTVDVDAQKNTVKAVAVGATALDAGKNVGEYLETGKLKAIAEQNLGDKKKDSAQPIFENDILAVFLVEKTKKMLGFFKKTQQIICVIDRQGIIKLVSETPLYFKFKAENVAGSLKTILEEKSVYGESGRSLPHVHLIIGGKIIDFSGLEQIEQIISLAALEAEGIDAETELLAIARRPKQ